MGSSTSVGQRLYRLMLVATAGLWRRLMVRTTVVAVTGSVGKSTCKELVGTVLASRYPTLRTHGGENHYRGAARTVLRLRPWHRFAVVEVGLDGPGQMAHFAWMVRPDIVVWTSVARTHTRAFGSLDAIAAEKAKLLASLRRGGCAVINDDDPSIAPWQPPAGVVVVRCGSTDRASVRVTATRGDWPDRFSLDAEVAGAQVRVHTSLVGTHWAPSVLPALAIGRLADIPLDESARAIAACPPLPRRLTPIALPNGATLLRDENGSVDTLPHALRVMERARAARRIVVFAGVSDSRQKHRQRMRAIGGEIARVADAAVFLGEHGARGADAAVAAGMRPEHVTSFLRVHDAALFLQSELRAGDLVLLRGQRSDHLGRIPSSMLHEVACWTDLCRKNIACEQCPELTGGTRQESRARV